MKMKNYQKPETTIVEVAIQNLMEAVSSGGPVLGGNGDDIDESRRGSAWDDED